MANDRILIVRVLGLGNLVGAASPVAFTSRSGLSYLAGHEVPNVIADMGSQLSSELPLFGAMGSDPTTSFNVIATAESSQLMLSRGKVPVLAADGANVTVTEYVKPFGTSGIGNVYVTDTTNVAAGDMIRVANTVFEVDTVVSSTVLSVRRRWGCADVPIPMVVTGYGIFGSTVYNVNPGNPTGGVESLPVVISTAPTTATSIADEEVIFRGIVNKVTTDKGAGGRNQIKVDCGSLMSFVRSAKFTPARGGTRVVPRRADLALDTLTAIQLNVDFLWQIVHDQRLYGTPWEVTGAVGDVRVPLLQVRDKGWGGTVALDEVAPWSNVTIDGFSVYVAQVGTRYHIDALDPTYMTSNTWLTTFRDGYFGGAQGGPTLDPTVTVQAVYTDANGNEVAAGTRGAQYGYRWRTQQNWFNDELLGETTFIGNDFASLVIDLLLGTYNEDLTFATGCRAATEAAWLPFGTFAGVNGIGDIIDVPSLEAATKPLVAGMGQINLPNCPLPGQNSILPYVHEDVKTIGDVLDELLKRLGLFMVYDAGKFRFGRWAARPPTPTVVNDTGLAEPRIGLNYDRQNCVQSVVMVACWRTDGQTVVTQKIPVNNVDLGIGALGKVLTLGEWTPTGSIEYIPQSEMFANAVGLVTRYSQAAAMVDVTYRDAVFDLIVGQQVAFSSDYVPNAEGGMGVTLATGFVLKAARSWQTPTTTYTIALPGYLTTINRLAVYSCSGTVVSVSGSNVVIAPNDFTQPSGLAETGAPTKDVEAFELSLQLQGGSIEVILRDQFGTYLGAVDTLSSVVVAADTLINLPTIAAAASPGDVIVLAGALTQSSVDTLWDVFQADTSGNVFGSPTLAYKWVL